MTSTVDSKGRVTIPAALRRTLGIREGDTVFVEAHGGELRVAKAVNPLDALAAEGSARASDSRSLSEDRGTRRLGMSLSR